MSINKKIGFLCSGNGAIFQKLCEACSTNLLKSNILVCIADRECNALHIARHYGIPDKLVLRENFKTRLDFSNRIMEILKEYKINLIYLAFDRLLTGTIIDFYYGKMINIHLSLLPAFKGFEAIQHTLQSGVRYGGVTLHLVNESIDGGAIIIQGTIPLSPNSTREWYNNQIFNLSYKMLIQLTKWYEEDRIKFYKEQPYILNGKYDSYPCCPKLEIF